MDQLERARMKLREERPPEEDKVLLEKGVSAHVHESKEQRVCSFCGHQAMIQIDDSAIMVCMHCFKIMEENLSSMKAFLGCG